VRPCFPACCRANEFHSGGLFHFRDVILKGNPDHIYVVHADIACAYPLEELTKFHKGHRGVGSIMGVKVAKEVASKYGCIVGGHSISA
jgi:mannose-1-phosphate guanylyltransferase